MTETTKGTPGVDSALSLESLDATMAERVDVFLQRAVAVDDPAKKDFHVRHAQQLLQAVKE